MGGQMPRSMVEGAQALVGPALNAVLGANGGGAQESTGLVTLFLNESFVDVRYYFYSYDCTGSAWGFKDVDQVFASVCSLTVRPLEKIAPEDMNFLIAQSMQIGSVDDEKEIEQSIEALEEIRLQLLVLQILGFKTQKADTLSLTALAEIAKETATANKAIAAAFSKLPDAPSLQALREAAGATHPMERGIRQFVHSAPKSGLPQVLDQTAPGAQRDKEPPIQINSRSVEPAKAGCAPTLLGWSRR